MSDWRQRLERNLEPILTLPDPRPEISAYHDMPYGIFVYPPDDEFDVREAQRLLATRLRALGKRVMEISLADCLSVALTRNGITVENIAAAESTTGTEMMTDTIHALLDRGTPLPDIVAERLPADRDPQRDIVFLVRAGALFPVYRSHTLLEQLKGRLNVPAVLFYPGDLDGAAGLRFMGILDADPNYRPRKF